LYQDDTEAYFDLSASLDAPMGLYYIQWSITEEYYTENARKTYVAPVNTLVEVTESKFTHFNFEIAG
jgi:hypothetical protein